jgi:hypothetical protein
VINSHNPYVPNVEAVSRKFSGARQREAFAQHRAWISVDVVGGMPDARVRKMVLGALGTLAVSLMDGQTSLVHATWRDEVLIPGPDLERALVAWAGLADAD